MAETPEEDKSDISSLDDREKEGSHNLHVPVAPSCISSSAVRGPSVRVRQAGQEESQEGG